MHHHHPHNPSHDPHTKRILPKTLLKRLKYRGKRMKGEKLRREGVMREMLKQGGEGSVKGKVAEGESEMVVEEPKIAEGKTEGEVEGEDVYSGDTVVLSEGGTGVMRSRDEKNVVEKSNRDEEVDQQVGNKEEVILVTDEEGVDEEEQPKEASTVRKLAETLATSGRTAEKVEDYEDEEEKEEINLIRRPRSSSMPLTEETTSQEERQE